MIKMFVGYWAVKEVSLKSIYYLSPIFPILAMEKYNAHRPWHPYMTYSIPTHDKQQWLPLQFIVLLMMEAKGVRNM